MCASIRSTRIRGENSPQKQFNKPGTLEPAGRNLYLKQDQIAQPPSHHNHRRSVRKRKEMQNGARVVRRRKLITIDKVSQLSLMPVLHTQFINIMMKENL